MPVEKILVDGKYVRTLKELLRPKLRTVFVGINPSLVSVKAGHYYQGQLGRRFWSRLTDFSIAHDLPNGREDNAAFSQGIGFADVVRRPTRSADCLSRVEIREGALNLVERLVDLGQPYPTVVFVYAMAAKACERALQDEGFATIRMPGPYEPKMTVERKMSDLKKELTLLS